MSTLTTFQQAEDPDLTMPWPVTVDDTGFVQYMEKYGIERRLLGFQLGEVQSVVVYLDEYLYDPELAIGLTPVYSGPESPTFFAIGTPVVSAWSKTAA